MTTLEIRDLHVTVDVEDGTKEILRGVDLTVRSGETHAIMGPNGSGKSTLAYSIAGHPKYTVTGGTVTLDGEDVLAMRVDARLLMTGGTVVLLWSMWEMSGWTPQINTNTLIAVTFLQGVGMGFVFVPMNLTAFATLSSNLRTDGTALINLVRNIGSAIGITVTTAVLTASTQVMHSQLAGFASPFNRALGVNAPGLFMNPQLPFGLANFNGLVEMRAATVAFSDDFLFMFYLGIPALGVIWLMKRPNFGPVAGAPVEVLE